MSIKFLVYLTLIGQTIFYFDRVEYMQFNIKSRAISNNGLDAWAIYNDRQCWRNPVIMLTKGELKRHLFAYEIILAAGYNISTPYTVTCEQFPNYPDICTGGYNKRPPTLEDWFNGNIRGFYMVGENEEGISLCQQGDVITNGTHIGFIIDGSNGQTISLGDSLTFKDDWGFRERQPNETFKILRYNGIDKSEEGNNNKAEFYKVYIHLLLSLIALI